MMSSTRSQGSFHLQSQVWFESGRILELVSTVSTSWKSPPALVDGTGRKGMRASGWATGGTWVGVKWVVWKRKEEKGKWAEVYVTP
jgi:hypothetical protein